ncbi:hypothetical protein IA854_13735 [Listeria seeligeri]|uniref:hypothetical protein n=1 Tax=Listeria seeligeri TaxID=1640 RepID=UPI0016262A9B|nr:hypothetical protein [Listeria seeligeri]MBC1990391.1 hypothetical protein [Listeria seeligeri]MBF2375204.1 hypothetical protein [Listeria seeligeri]
MSQENLIGEYQLKLESIYLGNPIKDTPLLNQFDKEHAALASFDLRIQLIDQMSLRKQAVLSDDVLKKIRNQIKEEVGSRYSRSQELFLAKEDKLIQAPCDFFELSLNPFKKTFVLDANSKFQELVVLYKDQATKALSSDNNKLNSGINGFSNANEENLLKKSIKTNISRIGEMNSMLKKKLPKINYTFDITEIETYDSSQFFKDVDAKINQRFQEVKEVIEKGDLEYSREQLFRLEDDIFSQLFRLRDDTFRPFEINRSFEGSKQTLSENVHQEIANLRENLRVTNFKDPMKPGYDIYFVVNPPLFLELADSYMKEMIDEKNGLFGNYGVGGTTRSSLEIEGEILKCAWSQYNEDSKGCFLNAMETVRELSLETLNVQQDKYIELTKMVNQLIVGNDINRAIETPAKQHLSIEKKHLNWTGKEMFSSSSGQLNHPINAVKNASHEIER